MSNNPEIEQILDNAIKLAKGYRHKYVTVEHLSLALIRFEPFTECLKSYGLDVLMLQKDFDQYIKSLTVLEVTKGQKVDPKRTNALERVFNRAGTQVLFSGRRNVSTIDVFLAIMSESQSHAHYFFLKYGMQKVQFVEYWSKHYDDKSSQVLMSSKQANELLEEHCTNLTDLAQRDRIEPVIGRGKEIDDIVHVLAKRFKANVLLVGDPGVGKTAIAEAVSYTHLRAHET